MRTLLALQHASATGTLRVEARGSGDDRTHRRWTPGVRRRRFARRQLGSPARAARYNLGVDPGHGRGGAHAAAGAAALGEVAQRLGVLSAEALRHALREKQVRGKLARCLHWERTQHVFVAGDAKVDPFPDGPLAMEPLLLHGIARHFSLDRMRTLLKPALNERVELWGRREDIEARLALSNEDKKLLSDALLAPSLDLLLRGQGQEPMRLGQLLCALALFNQLCMPEPEDAREERPVRDRRAAQATQRSFTEQPPAWGHVE